MEPGPASLAPKGKVRKCVAHGLTYDPEVHTGCVVCRRDGEVRPSRRFTPPSLLLVAVGIAMSGAAIYAAVDTPLVKRWSAPDLEPARRAFERIVGSARAGNRAEFVESLSSAALSEVPTPASQDAAMRVIAELGGASPRYEAGDVLFEAQSGTGPGARTTVVAMTEQGGTWRLDALGAALRVPKAAATAETEPTPISPELQITGKADIRSATSSDLLNLNAGASDFSDLSRAKLVFGDTDSAANGLVLVLDLQRSAAINATWDNQVLTRPVGGIVLGPISFCTVQLTTPLADGVGFAQGRILPCELGRLPGAGPEAHALREPIGGKFQVSYLRREAEPQIGVDVAALPAAPEGALDLAALPVAAGAGGQSAVVEGAAGATGAAGAPSFELGWPRGAGAYDSVVEGSAKLIVYFGGKSPACVKFESEVLSAPEVTAVLGGTPRVNVDPSAGDEERRVKNAVSSAASAPSVWLVQRGKSPEQIGGVESASHFADALASVLAGR